VKPAWEEIAERLRAHVGELVARRDISQIELADRTGYTQPHISNVLAGRRPLALSLAIALARATGTTISQLCDPDELRELRRWMDEQCEGGPAGSRAYAPPETATRAHAYRHRSTARSDAACG
jgi:transcriptional regulator with XRE-family HTH domain